MKEIGISAFDVFWEYNIFHFLRVISKLTWKKAFIFNNLFHGNWIYVVIFVAFIRAKMFAVTEKLRGISRRLRRISDWKQRRRKRQPCETFRIC